MTIYLIGKLLFLSFLFITGVSGTMISVQLWYALIKEKIKGRIDKLEALIFTLLWVAWGAITLATLCIWVTFFITMLY